MPWHILAPSAVACDKLPLRASAHPPEGFYDIGNEVSYIISKRLWNTCHYIFHSLFSYLFIVLQDNNLYSLQRLYKFHKRCSAFFRTFIYAGIF